MMSYKGYEHQHMVHRFHSKDSVIEMKKCPRGEGYTFSVFSMARESYMASSVLTVSVP